MSVTWELLDGPDGLELNPATGLLSWAEVVGPTRSETVSVRASNGVTTDTASFVLSIATTAPTTSSPFTSTGITGTGLATPGL